MATFAELQASANALEALVIEATQELQAVRADLANAITPAQGDILQAQLDTMANNLRTVVDGV